MRQVLESWGTNTLVVPGLQKLGTGPSRSPWRLRLCKSMTLNGRLCFQQLTNTDADENDNFSDYRYQRLIELN